MSLDVGATVVSLLPFEIQESKPGLNPQYFKIPAAPTIGDFGILKIEKASVAHYQPFEMPSIVVPVDLDLVARSVVDDYLSAKLYTNPPTAQPGLFWVHGVYSKEEIKAKFPDKLKEADKAQRQWYLNVVKQVDDMWVRSGKQHRVVIPEGYFACQALGLQREWNLTADAVMMACPVCAFTIPATVAFCNKCGCIIDEEKYKKFKFVGKPADPLLAKV